MNSNKVYVVPDVHGREFWHDVEKLEDYEKIIFLGDYVDPYPHEGVATSKGLSCLKEVIEFARQHENVVLLMGNHDSTYMIGTLLCECRTDYENFQEIAKVFHDNKDLFKLAYYMETENGPVIFTHAGLFADWLEDNELPTEAGKELVDKLNEKFSELIGKITDDIGDIIDKKGEHIPCKKDPFLKALGTVSFYRGGWTAHGSCIWSDIREQLDLEGKLENVFQVVGHTMLEPGVIVKFPHIACIDSQKVWNLKDIFDAKETIVK